MRFPNPGWLRGAALGALCLVASAIALPTPARADDKLPDVTEAVKDYTLDDGYFRVYRKKNHLLLEVPKGRLTRPFLLTTSMGSGRYAGFQWADMLVQFERLDKNLLLMEKNVQYRAEKGSAVKDVVDRTYTNRLVKAMPIKAESRTPSPARGLLIDLSALFGRNARSFFGDVAAGLDFSLAKVTKVKSFPKNLEVAITMPNKASGELVTLHYSLVDLPAKGYVSRVADSRVGYFLTAVKDFSKKGSGDRFVRYINRWRLDKKDPSLKLSPPKKPIVFYIEKTVPVRYRQAVREGILEWNKAYEKIGFYGAVEVYQQTDTAFADLDPEDARYSFFRWITSERGFAMGPSRVNPMSGEIFDADIIFDDAMVRSYLRQYEVMLKKTPGTFMSPRVQKEAEENPFWHPFYGTRLYDAEVEVEELDLLPADHLRGACSLGEGKTHQLTRAFVALLAGKEKKKAAAGEEKKEEEEEIEEDILPDDFLTNMVREVVMHEVGHTLGLRHNFVASTWKPLSEINGENADSVNVASVMDYNPINVAVPGTSQGAYVTSSIGPYDYWAISYGYKPVKNNKELDEIAKRISEEGLDYATDEDAAQPDPYVLRWDMSQDPLEFARAQIDLTEDLLPKVAERLIKDGESFAPLRRAIDMLLYDIHFAGIVAARFVGGERYRRDHKSEGGRKPIEPVSAEKQREAMKLIAERILRDKAFQLPPELLQHLASERWSHWGQNPGASGYPIHDRVLGIQRSMLAQMLDPERLDRIRDHHLKVAADAEAYSLGEHFQLITDAVFEELDGAPEGPFTVKSPYISTMRQNLQRTWIDFLVQVAVKGRSMGPEIQKAIAYQELGRILSKINDRNGNTALDIESGAHLTETLRRIEKARNADFAR